MPCRPGIEGALYRHLPYGDLVDLILLDTRVIGRDAQSSDPAVVYAEDRQLLGAAQEQWLFDRLDTSGAQWKLLCQQVVLHAQTVREDPSDRPPPINEDAWDGYPAARERLLRHIESGGITDVVVLTGDVHSSWAADLPVDPWNDYSPSTGRGSVGVELVTPAITSTPPSDLAGGAEVLLQLDPHLKWVDVRLRGTVVLDVTPEAIQADWFLIADGATEAETYVAPEWAKGFRCRSGRAHLVEVDAPAAAKVEAPELA